MSAARHTTSGVPLEEVYHFHLPPRCRAALDADGVVRGKTWRDFLYGGHNNTLAALSWWLWKRQLPVEREEVPDAS